MNLKSDDEFSASACQKIHSELLASVNEIYKNLKTKPLLKRNAISTSSLSNVPNKNFRKLSKSKSIDCKQTGPVVNMVRTKPREETVGSGSNSSNKLPKHLRRRVEKTPGKYLPLKQSLLSSNDTNKSETEQVWDWLDLLSATRNH